MNIKSILLFSSLWIFSGCFQEYFDHWESEHTPAKIWENTGGYLSWNLIILPNEEELKKLVQKLWAAKKRIWLETYTWTEKQTQESVLRAKEWAVDVRVILEGNVFQTPRINDPIMKKLKEANIDAIFASDTFKFTHMKMWIIDDEWCISTWNWSYTSFTKNREFIFCSFDKDILQSLEEIFLSDFLHKRPIFSHSGMDSRIGLAPWNLRDFLSMAIQNAKSEIILYNQSISDEALIAQLAEKSRSGTHIELCQSEKSSTWSDYWNLKMFTSEKPYLHAKIFLIDGVDVILWSANITQNALDNNREIMIKIENNPIFYKKIKNLYNIDCKRQP
jgi:phosphatidylserine/phosphatidylglycerophosphate/cardiolipin synthase-like enzyme